MADTIRNENEEKNIDVTAPITAKKKKTTANFKLQYLHNQCPTDLNCLLCYGDIDFKA